MAGVVGPKDGQLRGHTASMNLQQSLYHPRQFNCPRSWREQPDVGPFNSGSLSDRLSKTTRATRTLLVDNYDSYTYNLYQSLALVNGQAPTVIKNDEWKWRDLAKKLARRDFDNIVISPGPGTPANPKDLGVCKMILEEAEDTPVLGVCLGMQALAHVHDARVHKAAEAVHGRLSRISHNSHPLFNHIPSGVDSDFLVVRYHSLAVDPESLPESLEAIAWTCGSNQPVHLRSDEVVCGKSELQPGTANIIMGLAHRSRPHWGVQFHPESIGTKYGDRLLRNFKHKTVHFHGDCSSGFSAPKRRKASTPALEIPEDPEVRQETLQVEWDVLEGGLDSLDGSEGIFKRLLSSELQDTFWLDSASEHGQRFSYMGCKGGPLWQRLTFKLAPANSASKDVQKGTLEVEDAWGKKTVTNTHFLEFLEGQLKQQYCKPDASLPFDFSGGYVGYLGYEMKAECGMPGVHESSHPDAAFFFADRVVVVDHLKRDVYLVALNTAGNPAQKKASLDWLSATRRTLLEHILDGSVSMPPPCSAAGQAEAAEANPTSPTSQERLDGRFGDEEQILGRQNWLARRSRLGYIADVEECLDALHQGESYELCYTTMLKHLGSVDAMKLYLELRTSNPSMHASWLDFGPGVPKICCSSPERFLKGDREGWVEARPIKGTARRYSDPVLDEQSKSALLSSPKARAENLMIVDLLRNDLGRFCQVGTVHVPDLMKVESYATVHNLVSTIRGKRNADTTVVDCLRAAFPGGSMTGAPKIRSLEILDRLENGPRGVYSGSLGFIGVNGTFNLNIVIRTAIVSPDSVHIGAGGAIVLQSDAEAEYEEMRLKASALVRALDKCRGEEYKDKKQEQESSSIVPDGTPAQVEPLLRS